MIAICHSNILEITFEPLRCTKELVLKKVSEEELMEYYLGVKVQKGLFCSPLRSDKSPTCSFYRNRNGDLIFKDFGCQEHCGNFITIVMIKYNCSYAKAMQIIGNDFGILSMPNLERHTAALEYTGSKLEVHKEAIIRVEIQEFSEYELKWWKSYGVGKDTLNKFHVFSCKNIWLNNNLFYLYNQSQHIYGYYGGIRGGIETWRIYRPGFKKFKFLSNWKSTQIQGSHMLPKDGGDLLIIQKSLKDVMALYEFGIPSIAPNSENTVLTEATIEKLKSKFKNIIFWYDNDDAGKQSLSKIKDTHPELFFYYIPEEYNIKDFSDFIKSKGRDKAKDLLNNMLNSFNICLNVEQEPIIEIEDIEQNRRL